MSCRYSDLDGEKTEHIGPCAELGCANADSVELSGAFGGDIEFIQVNNPTTPVDFVQLKLITAS